MNMKYIDKLRKRNTSTNLLSTEYCVIDEEANLKGTYQTLKEAQKMLKTNPTYKGYKFQTYKIETTTKI